MKRYTSTTSTCVVRVALAITPIPELRTILSFVMLDGGKSRFCAASSGKVSDALYIIIDPTSSPLCAFDSDAGFVALIHTLIGSIDQLG